jgi:hypothetical protein
MQNFFFIATGGKFLRIDLAKVTRVTSINDTVCLQTLSESHSLFMSVDQVKQLLPPDRFVWVSENIAESISSPTVTSSH